MNVAERSYCKGDRLCTKRQYHLGDTDGAHASPTELHSTFQNTPPVIVMATSESFVDIHCHMLPELDDGAADWDEALAMAQIALDDGVGTVVLTPHQLGNFSHNRGDAIRQQVTRFQSLLQRHAMPLNILPGADVRIEPEIVHKIRSGDVLTLADRRGYVLLELPHEVYLPLERLLSDLKRAGLVGILSHPERNLGILNQPNIAERLVDTGCLMQVTAGSLVGTFGAPIQTMAEYMVSRGLVHFLATDAHGCQSRRPLMRRAFDRVCRMVGPQVAVEICAHNPARVVKNQRVVHGRLQPRRKAVFSGWFTSRKAS